MNNIEYFEIPKTCPICGAPTVIECEVDTEVLACRNPQCLGQVTNMLDHFCGKKGLDIRGLSKATLEKLVEWDWVSEPADLYELQKYKTEWIKKPGFGERSVSNILQAIEDSRNPQLASFISALGIPMVGRVLSKELAKHFDNFEDFRIKAEEHWDFTQLDGVAYEKASCIWNYNFAAAARVAEKMLGFQSLDGASAKSLEGKKIVITGTLQKCKNRGELQALIESAGGRVLSSISGNVDILINNNVNSTSSKNVAAKKLNIPILSEEEFFKEYLTF